MSVLKLFILALFMCSSLYGEIGECPVGNVPIKSLFGVRTGVRPNDVEVQHDKQPQITYYDGKILTVAYNFTPSKPFRDFNFYQFYVDPRSGLIISIRAERRLLPSQEAAIEEQRTVVNIMEKKFGVKFWLSRTGISMYEWRTPGSKWWPVVTNGLRVHGTFGWGKQYQGYVVVELNDHEVEEQASRIESANREKRISTDMRGIDAL